LQLSNILTVPVLLVHNWPSWISDCYFSI